MEGTPSIEQPATEQPALQGDVAVTREGAVATLWLNRPAKRNAVTYEMWQELARTTAALATDASVRVLVVRGSGDHFCAGADVESMSAAGRERFRAANRDAEEALSGFPKPVLACIRGACVGGGVEIAVACDLRFAAAGSRFGITPARLGITYPGFAIERVARLVGPAAAKHLLFSAELVDAERALRIGLVDEVHSEAALEARVHDFARLLSERRSLLTQQASKAMVDAVRDRGAIPPELETRWAGLAAAAPDFAEGLAAFREKREPRFPWNGPDLPMDGATEPG